MDCEISEDFININLDNNYKNTFINTDIITPIIKDSFEEISIEQVLKKMNEHIAFLYEEIKMLKKEIFIVKKYDTE